LRCPWRNNPDERLIRLVRYLTHQEAQLVSCEARLPVGRPYRYLAPALAEGRHPLSIETGVLDVFLLGWRQ
jgi:hypothetical protein